MLGLTHELFSDSWQKSVADAMRELLEAFRLPGEAQQISRITETFAEIYFASGPGTTSTALVSTSTYHFLYSGGQVSRCSLYTCVFHNSAEHRSAQSANTGKSPIE